MEILIIDDHEMVTDGIIIRLNKIFSEVRCYAAKNYRMAYSFLAHQKIDLVLCDLEFTGTNDTGFEIAEKIRKNFPEIKLVALTHYHSYRIMNKAKKAGFHSFLSKGCTLEDFEETLIQVLRQGTYESPVEKELKQKRRDLNINIFNDSLNGIYNLSKRELEIALLTLKTTDRKKMSKITGLKPYTVDSHLKSIYNKLHLNNKKELSLIVGEFYNIFKKQLSKK